MDFIKKFRKWCDRHTGLLVLRVVLGLFMAAHGVLKFQNMGNTVAFFGDFGFSPFLAYFVSGAEVVGGVALIAGVFACIFGILLAVIQLVAIYKVTGRIPAPSLLVGFTMGYGMNLLLAAASLGIAFSGPGRFAFWQGRCCGWCRHDMDRD